MSNPVIRYNTDHNAEFIQVLRLRVKEYFVENKISEHANGTMIFKSVFMLALYLVPYILMVSGVVTTVPWALACWIVMGVGVAGIGMGIMHDAIHGAYSGNSKINRLMGSSLYLIGGFPATWRYQHNNRHHGFPNIEGYDEDIDPPAILRLSPYKPVKKMHRFQQWYAWFIYGIMTFTWVIDKDFKQLARYRREKAPLGSRSDYRKMFIKLILSKVAYYIFILVIPLLVVPIPWYYTLLFYFVMHFVSGLTLGVVFQAAHVVPSSVYPLPDTSGRMEKSWAEHQLMTTSNFAPRNHILSWMSGGLNNQVEHHLFPNICHVHYRKIAPIVRATAEEFGLPYHVQKNFRQAIRNHFTMLKSLGRQKVPATA